ncbi:MAG: hypothetical protein K1X83_05945 [Oligoflexia bacterium]|nr:hypothetical protein [Oligoflexia bacterium]
MASELTAIISSAASKTAASANTNPNALPQRPVSAEQLSQTSVNQAQKATGVAQPNNKRTIQNPKRTEATFSQPDEEKEQTAQSQTNTVRTKRRRGDGSLDVLA